MILRIMLVRMLLVGLHGKKFCMLIPANSSCMTISAKFCTSGP